MNKPPYLMSEEEFLLEKYKEGKLSYNEALLLFSEYEKETLEKGSEFYLNEAKENIKKYHNN